MADFRKIINKDKALIGMVHLRALPGTSGSSKSPQQIVDIAVSEATKLVEYGFDAVLLENMHQNFIGHVQARRGDRLDADSDLFTGEFWLGDQSVKLGLADGIGHLVPKMKEVFGGR